MFGKQCGARRAAIWITPEQWDQDKANALKRKSLLKFPDDILRNIMPIWRGRRNREKRKELQNESKRKKESRMAIG